MAIEKRIGRGWALIIVVLGIEVLGIAWLAFEALLSVISDAQNPLLEEYRSSVVAQGVGIVAMLVLCTLWLAVTCVGALRRRSWARASNLTVQVLVIAGATGVLQGIMGSTGLGVMMLALGLIGLLGTWLSRPQRTT